MSRRLEMLEGRLDGMMVVPYTSSSMLLRTARVNGKDVRIEGIDWRNRRCVSVRGKTTVQNT